MALRQGKKLNTSDKKILSNSAWLIIQNIYNSLLGVVITYFASRFFGPDRWGVYNYALSWISILSVIASMGLGSILVNEILDEKEERKVVDTALCIRGVVSLLFFVIILVMYIISPKTTENCLLVLQGVTLLLQGYFVLAEWYLVKLLSRFYVIAFMIGSTIGFLWKISVVFLKGSLELFSIGIIFEALLVFVIAYAIYKKHVKGRLSFSLAFSLEMLKKSWFFAIGDMAIIIYTEIDKIIIKQFLSPYDVGIYSAALAIAGMWVFVPSMVYYSYKPAIIANWKNDGAGVKQLKKLTFFLFGICLVFIVGLTFFGKFVVLILFGEDFLPAAGVVPILSVAMTFSIIGMLGTIWILAEKINRFSMYRSVIGALVNIVLDYIMVQEFGIYGAAWATVISYFIITIGCMAIWKPTRGFLTIWAKKDKN